MKESHEEETRLQNEAGLSQFFSRLVESLEDLRCDLWCPERGMIWGTRLAAFRCLMKALCCLGELSWNLASAMNEVCDLGQLI